MKINIHEFSNQFNKEYDFLYENDDRVAGYEEAVDAFDMFISKPDGQKFVGEFVNYREDFISSDREVASFMFALEHFEMEE